MLSTDRALPHYDVNRPVKLFCDASAYSLGMCLVHIMGDGSQKPIAYASRTISKPERAYAQIEREGLALVFGVRRFHQYLYGRPFILVKNHRPLCKIPGSKQGIPLWLQHGCRGGPSPLVHTSILLNISMVQLTSQLTTVLIACRGCHCLGRHRYIYGSVFTSKEFNHFTDMNGIKHLTTAPYHPAWNGLAERAVQTLKTGLKKMTAGNVH